MTSPRDDAISEREVWGAESVATLGRMLETMAETPRNPVSSLDTVVESHFRDLVRDAFPDDIVIGEEIAERSTWHGTGWILDPIDGTNNFEAGLPTYAISLAFAMDGDPELGWVLDVTGGQVFFARRGQGAFQNGEPLRSDEAANRRQLLSISGPFRRTQPELFSALAAGRSVRTLGCTALELAWTASGALSFSAFAETRSWDIAAGVLLVKESGGLAIDLDRGGEPEFVAHDGSEQALRDHRYTLVCGHRQAIIELSELLPQGLERI